MTDPAHDARAFLALTRRARAQAALDPFANPVLAVAAAIGRRLDNGDMTVDAMAALVRTLRDGAFDNRATRLADYLASPDGATADDPRASMAALARTLAAGTPATGTPATGTPATGTPATGTPATGTPATGTLDAFRAATGRVRFAAVFTAHPTFALPPPVFAALAEAACGRPSSRFDSHRPTRPTLDDEFAAAAEATARGRDALDALNTALLDAARERWPFRWTELSPSPLIMASWVGYDTDGRVDIGWYDTLRLRLRNKLLGLQRLRGQVANDAPALAARLHEAAAATEAQLAACPADDAPDAAAAFEAALSATPGALSQPDPLLPAFAGAIATADEPARLRLLVARAGLLAHGLSLAHTHVRLNAAQLHNAARLRLGLAEPPSDPSRRRVLLSAVDEAMDRVAPIPSSLPDLADEQASAVRLMMTVAAMVRHVDSSVPVRFLIAETESGYTLLVALWLALAMGIDAQVEISPLFETGEALERGARVLEEALRSPHYRAYLRRTGRLCLQFGYSDSGRYVGQLDASYLIERLRRRVVEALERHAMTGVEVVLFDTHGESIGRGAHPGTLRDRLGYLSPPATRIAFAAAGIRVREESAFQGGDGYLLFGTPELALLTVARIAEHALTEPDATPDPVYDDPDFTADFFGAVGAGMRGLVEDPGYAALLGAFGPALLDPTGSRPAARQSDSRTGGAIRHPSQLRAIPNNAILQQLGWCANTLHGLGDAVSRHPEQFADLRNRSGRFRRAIDLASHALRHSDIDVLRAVVAMFDPGSWLDRALRAPDDGRRDALVRVAGALERLDLLAPAQATFRRIQADHLRLRTAWPDAPRMADEEVLLHALRLALVQHIWLLGTQVPEFSPRHGITPADVQDRFIRLDVPGALEVLEAVFPIRQTPHDDDDGPARARWSYEREHAGIFAPVRDAFALVREIGTAVTHAVGAFG